MKLKEVEVPESELEELLAEDLGTVEEGMKVLGRQIRTDTGPLDILAVDEEKVLTIIELKTTKDDGQLDQGMRCYDWAYTNIDLIIISFNIEPTGTCSGF